MLPLPASSHLLPPLRSPVSFGVYQIFFSYNAICRRGSISLRFAHSSTHSLISAHQCHSVFGPDKFQQNYGGSGRSSRRRSITSHGLRVRVVTVTALSSSPFPSHMHCLVNGPPGILPHAHSCIVITSHLSWDLGCIIFHLSSSLLFVYRLHTSYCTQPAFISSLPSLLFPSRCPWLYSRPLLILIVGFPLNLRLVCIYYSTLRHTTIPTAIVVPPNNLPSTVSVPSNHRCS